MGASVINKVLDTPHLSVQIVLTLLMVVVWPIVEQGFIYHARVTEVNTETRACTPADFAIIVSDLPRDAT